MSPTSMPTATPAPTVKAQILVVDDEPAMCALLAEQLGRRGYAVVTSTSVDQALGIMRGNAVDVVIADHNMPGKTGVALCDEITANYADVPVVLITAFGSMETAIAAIRAGAYDFLTKPFEIEQLVLVLERALAHSALKAELRRLRRVVAEAPRLSEILGESPPVREMCELVSRAAPSDATVLITGESGTGKDLVARALHDNGPRKDGPFVAINCAALTETLLESELFGHKRGAFTDARESRPGLLVQARGGTVFLDEIGDMPPSLQAKLLRTIETRTVRPVGSDAETAIDVRFVAATNRDLETDAEEGRFRQDLFFRINVIQIPVPPLRGRGNDVLLLAQHFLQRAAARNGRPVLGLSPAAAERLSNYNWPGNVRELQNAIERAVALTVHEHIIPDDFPERIRNHRPAQLAFGEDQQTLLPMHEVERRYFFHVLESVQGNKTVAARILGFDRRTMYRKLERFQRGGPGADGDE
ncbi:MAG TPA: sigma-54 dependent transcriptional regulator [Polyangia bacterium]